MAFPDYHHCTYHDNYQQCDHIHRYLLQSWAFPLSVVASIILYTIRGINITFTVVAFIIIIITAMVINIIIVNIVCVIVAFVCVLCV